MQDHRLYFTKLRQLNSKNINMRSLSLSYLLLVIFLSSQAQTSEPHLPKVQTGKPNRYVVFPVIVKSPEYIWGLGAAGTLYFKLKHDSITRTSNFKGVSFYTLRRQLVFASEGYVYFPSEDFILHNIATISHFPDKFWGLGNNTTAANVENYAISQIDLYPQLLKNIYSDLFVGVGYEFQSVYQFTYDKSGNSLFDNENIVGRQGGHISGAGFIMTWDSRNNAFSPSAGFYAQYSMTSYQDYFGSNFNFIVNNVDVRKYFAMPKDRVMAMQFNLIASEGNVPIRSMANIGTNSYMRGYYEGRFTDKNLTAFQTEFRTPIWKRLGAVIFGGAGKVGARFRDLWNFDHLKPTAGMGLRFAISPKEKLNLRLDAGVGRQSHGSYLNMGEAF